MNKNFKINEIFGNENIFCLAPMFEVNDLSFRLLCRKYGIKVCWSGMINTHIWVNNPNLRERLFKTIPEDRPLIIQLSGSNEEEIIQTAKDLEGICDAIDLNLGCTQHIARRGQYGYFLVNTEKKRQNVIKMVENISNSLNIPLTVKIRILNNENDEPDFEITTDFAKALENVGVSLLSIHGRHKKLDKSGPVNINCFKSIVSTLKIPVIINGGIESKEEALNLIQLTGSFGVMVGKGLLKNPSMFNIDSNIIPFQLSMEYIELFKLYPDNFYIARRHIFNFYEKYIRNNEIISEKLKTTHDINNLINIIKEIDFLIN